MEVEASQEILVYQSVTTVGHLLQKCQAVELGLMRGTANTMKHSHCHHRPAEVGIMSLVEVTHLHMIYHRPGNMQHDRNQPEMPMVVIVVDSECDPAKTDAGPIRLAL